MFRKFSVSIYVRKSTMQIAGIQANATATDWMASHEMVSTQMAYTSALTI